MKKRLLAIALTLALLLGFGGVSAFAATPEEEARALLEQTVGILNGKIYILKGRSTSPTGGFTTLVMAMDQDKLMAETEMDWPAMVATTGAPRLAGFILQLVLGKSMRMVLSPEGMYWIFPDRRLYLDLGALMGGDMGGFMETLDMLGVAEVPEDLDVTQPVIGGKTYLCVTLENQEDGNTSSYYFLNGQLKRITVTQYGEDMVIEIDQFSAQVDESYFSTRWLLPIPLRWLAPLFTSFIPIY